MKNVLKPSQRKAYFIVCPNVTKKNVIDFDVPHTTRCQKLPYYTAAILWNSLPVESRLSPSIDNF